MYKLWISIKKEYYVLINDLTGLTLMFLMPLLLVIIITIIQDSAYKVVNENKISLLLVNHDSGVQGEELSKMLIGSGMFELKQDNELTLEQLNKEVLGGRALTGLYITHDYSEKLEEKSSQFSQFILSNLGLVDSVAMSDLNLPTLKFVNDPALQDNYIYSIINVVYTYLNVIEITQMLEGLYGQMGQDNIPDEVKKNLFENRITVERSFSDEANVHPLPNSSQHNVPAWTIFAMFFMVVSLGTSLVQEKNSGSFLRLKAMPTHFGIVMFSKQLIFMLVGILQVLFIFSVGVFLFPLIGLPPLAMPFNVVGILVVVLISSFSAVSYALMLGSLSRTPEQANGFGAISIIIFAAIGGVWIPTFVMPAYMKIISQFSPLHWCIEAFYVLFLRGGQWAMLLKPLFILVVFSFICQFISYIKLKRDRLI